MVRLPFLINKSLIEALVDDSKEHGLKPGAGLALKAFHKEVFEGLQIPWCVQRSYKGSSSKYVKGEALRLDFYCPWPACPVSKRWFLMKPELLETVLKRPVNRPENILKRLLLEQFASKKNEIPNSFFIVVELIGGSDCHKHITFSKQKSTLMKG